jgi:hypothetical protein
MNGGRRSHKGRTKIVASGFFFENIKITIRIDQVYLNHN